MNKFFTSVKAIFLACFFILISIVVNAQSGEKWATGGNSVSSGSFVGTTNYYPLIAKVNNTEYLRITPTGNVGISNTNPVYKFDVSGRFHATGNVYADSSITAMNLYAIQKVTADALQVNSNSQLNGSAVFGNKITVDGNNSSIFSSTSNLNFQSTNLATTGNLNAANLNLSSLQGTGKMLLQADSVGKLIPFALPDNSGLVLYGNGTWGLLPQKSPWIADSIGIYPDSTLTNTNVFVKNLYASNSVSIGTFSFKNGLPGERDSISAEKRITIYAPSKIELYADTLTMKSNVGIGVAQPQSALDVAGDINTSGTVYANNLYAQNSIAIGTLKISNGAPGSGKDSIASPYKLALVSAGREISLISDTVKIGDYASTVRFDVNGSVRVRDVLWVETGLIVGRKFEGDKATVDTVAAKSVAATSVTAVNVTAQNVATGNFNADSLTSAISRSDTAFTQRLVVDGDAKVKGDAVITGNLKVNGSLTGITSFDSLHVVNKIKIGNSMYLLGYGGGIVNHIYTDDTGDPTLYIQSNWDNFNTILNKNNGIVGIGTTELLAENYENPGALKLDVCGQARFYSPTDGLLGGTSNYLRVGYNGANAIIDNYGTGGLLINYYSGKDVVIGNFYGTDHTANGSLTVQNKIGIGTNPSTSNAAVKLHIKGYTCTGGTLCSTQIEEGSEEASTIMRIEDEVYGQTNRNVWWDFIVSGVNQKLYINSQSGSIVNKIMTMTETGNVGIGTTNPISIFQVKSSTDKNLSIMNWDIANNGGLTINAHNDLNSAHIPLNFAAEKFYFYNGNVGIGTGDPQAKLDINAGNSLALNITSQASDWEYCIKATVPQNNNFVKTFAIWQGTTENFIIYSNGDVRARSIHVKVGTLGDFVFDENYELLSIAELEEYLKQNHHLPGIPSATEINENGLDVGEFQNLLLQKVEEQSLYIISLQKQIDELKNKIQELKLK